MTQQRANASCESNNYFANYSQFLPLYAYVHAYHSTYYMLPLTRAKLIKTKQIILMAVLKKNQFYMFLLTQVESIKDRLPLCS